ncbi:hypothetical protein VST7929_02741 [Vibrio stylophorae]|uniref:Uncharacterized protein n=1 Tax=Vibrio stylophorae TaxID=659351 RepID=A0ABM8ZXR6_9VIBR|nr:hypothetical protein VST7929_02741 [Vibrio stylophorae]
MRFICALCWRGRHSTPFNRASEAKIKSELKAFKIYKDLFKEIFYWIFY